MGNEIIEIESYVATKLQLEHMTVGSETLVVLLPGNAYTIYGPSLFYAYSMVSEMGLDVLSIEYGFQKTNKVLKEEDYPYILDECKRAICQALEKKYSRIVFIGKSFGTKLMADLIDEYEKSIQVISVFISPTQSALECIMNKKNLMIIGTEDRFLNSIRIEDLKKLNNVELFIVEGGDHFLEVGDFEKSIDYMRLSTIRIKEYLQQELN